jgi:integrase/recombinase XerD
MAVDQTTIFSNDDAPVKDEPTVSPNSTLVQCVVGYQGYMKEAGFSEHTVKAFSGDLRLLQSFIEPQTPIHEIGTQELNQFLYWLQYERGVPCSPKSYARRVTTIKSFFGWLTSVRVTIFDPATAIVHKRIVSQLPQVLTDEEVDRLLEITESLTTDTKPDPRPHLLATLLLETGIKKAECMRLTPDDFDRSDPNQATVLIRYSDPRLLHKERRLDVSPEVLDTLDQYLEQYKPGENIFECTPRNLEYVLADVAELSHLPNKASFESLRWTSALRDYRDGASADKLRYKMGLSKVTWRETENKLEKLNSGDSE